MTGVASDLANMVDMIGQSLQVIQVDDGIRALQAADVTDGSIVGGIFPAGQVPFQGGQIGDGCQPGSIGYWLLGGIELFCRSKVDFLEKMSGH